MQLRVHEFLQPGQEMPTKTFEHFLGHFFHRYMPMEGWKMELWVGEEEHSHEQADHNSHYSCRVQLERPDKTRMQAKKKSSNLSAAIYYTLKAVHRDMVELMQPQTQGKKKRAE